MSLQSEILEEIREFQRTGKLPETLTPTAASKVAASAERYATQAGVSKIEQFTNAAVRAAEDQLRYEETGELHTGEKAIHRNALKDFLEKNGTGTDSDLKFFLRVPGEVGLGAGRYLREVADPEQIDLYPGWELVRMYDRAIPRGEEKTALTRVPGRTTAWVEDNGRWVAACVDAQDLVALQIFKATGRMVALKASKVWASLGNGAGGYDDALGNPFGPFAFNSGMDLVELSRTDCEELGLLEEDEPAPSPVVDYDNIFDLKTPQESWEPFKGHRQKKLEVVA